MTSPAPVYVARAVADALADDARAAARYLDEHAAMIAAGVPVEHVRAVLDLELRATECTRAVGAWNDRGTLCLCGSLGVGKTIAAAQWLLSAVREGVSVMWLNAVDWSETEFKSQPALVARAKRVRALVIDDIGAGTTGPRGHRKVAADGERDWYFQQIEGVLMKRAALPTIALANMHESGMETWMGPRLMDRERMYGAVVFVQGKSLRAADRGDYSGDGLGPKHAAARRLVDALGVQPASSWDHELAKEVERVDVGHVLEQHTRSAHAFARSRLGFEISKADDPAALEGQARTTALRTCSGIAKAHGLDGEKIREAAVDLEANDPAARLLAKVAETLGQDTPMARSKRRFADSIAAENAERSRVCQETLEAMTTRLRGEADPSTLLLEREPAAWTKGPEGLAKMQAPPLGYRVTPLGGGRRGFEVRQGKGAGRMVLPAHETAALAWQALRVWLTPPPPPKDDAAATAAVIARAREAHGLG